MLHQVGVHHAWLPEYQHGLSCRITKSQNTLRPKPHKLATEPPRALTLPNSEAKSLIDYGYGYYHDDGDDDDDDDYYCFCFWQLY